MFPLDSSVWRSLARTVPSLIVFTIFWKSPLLSHYLLFSSLMIPFSTGIYRFGHEFLLPLVMCNQITSFPMGCIVSSILYLDFYPTALFLGCHSLVSLTFFGGRSYFFQRYFPMSSMKYIRGSFLSPTFLTCSAGWLRVQRGQDSWLFLNGKLKSYVTRLLMYRTLSLHFRNRGTVSEG